MLRAIALLALSIAIPGCSGDNRIDTAAEGRAVPAWQGVLVVGLERAAELDDTSFAVDFGALGANGRLESAPQERSYPRRASATLAARAWLRSPPPGRFAFALAPGDYVLEKLYIPEMARPTVDWSTIRDPHERNGRSLSAGEAFAMVMALSLAKGIVTGAAGEAPEPKAKPTPTHYVNRGLAAAAPRFEVRAGEVLYVGDLLIGVELYEKQVVDAWSTRGPNAEDQPSTSIVRDQRLFAEHGFDMAAARRFVAGLALGDRPFRTQSLRLSDEPRTMLRWYPPPDPTMSLRVVRARPAEAADAVPSPPSATTPRR